MIKAPISASDSALVLVDMQNLALKYAASNPDIARNVKAMVDFAHQKHIPVLYTVLNMRQDLQDRPVCISEMNLGMDSLYPAPAFLEGSEDAELIPELHPEAQDFVVIKRRTNAFVGTDLELYLRTLGAKTLLMGGISTEMGVEDTARYARNLDFNVVILKDCCATGDQAIQDWLVEHVFPMIGRSMTSAEVMADLQ